MAHPDDFCHHLPKNRHVNVLTAFTTGAIQQTQRAIIYHLTKPQQAISYHLFAGNLGNSPVTPNGLQGDFGLELSVETIAAILHFSPPLLPC